MTAASLAFRLGVAVDVLAVMFYGVAVLAVAVGLALAIDGWQRSRKSRQQSAERQRVLARSKQRNAEDDGLLGQVYGRRLDDRVEPPRRSNK